MKLSLFLCLAGLAWAHAATFSADIAGCACDCECPDPPTEECPTPCTCEPESVCNNFLDPNSPFTTICAPHIEACMVDLMYSDCLAAEAAGESRLGAFLYNIMDICMFKVDEPVEWLEYPCDCPPECECEDSSVCDNFLDSSSPFSTICAPHLEDCMVDLMHSDCLAAEAAGEPRLSQFLANIMDICMFKVEEPFEWLEYPCDCPTECECEDASVCDNFMDPNSPFTTICAPHLEDCMVDLMYSDCLAAEAAGEPRLSEFLANIMDICMFKVDEPFEWLEYPCDCPTTPPPVVILEPCVCECVCPPPSCTTLPPTTTCPVIDVCAALYEAPFVDECTQYLDDMMVDQMRIDCAAKADDPVALAFLFANLEDICAFKGAEIDLVIPVC